MSEHPENDLRHRLIALLDEGVEPVSASEARGRSELHLPAGPCPRWRSGHPVGPWRLGAIGALALAGVVLVGIVVLVAVQREPGSNTPPAPLSGSGLLATSTGPCTGRAAGCGSPESSAAALAHGKWATFARGPLSARSGQVEVWTGNELIVWGGYGSGLVPLGDGAAYDPRTRTWTMLPASPLRPTEDAAATWTGTEMVVLGGEAGCLADSSSSCNGAEPTDAVAAYVPATNTWHRLPPLPMGQLVDPSALWTGRQLVVVGGSVSPNGVLSDKTAAFDPATSSWARLPLLPRLTSSGPKWRLIDAVPAWTGTSLDVLVTWQRSGLCGKGCGYVRARSATWSLPVGGSAWHALPKPTVALGGAVTAWTGRDVIVAGGTYCPWSCPPPIRFAALYSPRTRGWSRALGSGPVSASPGVWTGKAFVSVRTSRTHPFEGATLGAWDAATRAWTRLAGTAAVLDNGAGRPAVWTGTELLVWGATGMALVVPPPT